MVKIPEIAASKLVEIVSGSWLKGESAGNDIRIGTLAEPLDAGSDSVAFIISPGFLKDLAKTKAAVLVVQQAMTEQVKEFLPPGVRACIATPDAYLALAKVTEFAAKHDSTQDWRVARSGEPALHPSAKIDATARVAPGAVVCEGAVIGPRTTILPNAVVGPGARVGADCTLFPGSILYPRTVIGDRVRVHANAVLGSDGFGYARSQTGAAKIWHLGRLVVEDDVEFGAGTTVDRGTIRDTVIERGSKIDNQVQVGHNVHIKAHAILCAQVGLAGNAKVGRGAILAGKVGVGDKVEIGDGAVIGASSGVAKDVKPGEEVLSTWTSLPRREWWRLIAMFQRLPQLYDRVKELETRDK